MSAGRLAKLDRLARNNPNAHEAASAARKAAEIRAAASREWKSERDLHLEFFRIDEELRRKASRAATDVEAFYWRTYDRMGDVEAARAGLGRLRRPRPAPPKRGGKP